MDVFSFGSMGAGKEVGNELRLKHERYTLSAFEALIVSAPRKNDKWRCTNSVNYAEKVI